MINKASFVLSKERDLKEKYKTRVRSWLRMNAGGVLNTCKSNEVLRRKFSDGRCSYLVADG